MKFMILASIALFVGFFGCAKENAIVNPNSTNGRVPLVTLNGITIAPPVSNALAKTAGTDPLKIMQASSHPKLAIIWFFQTVHGDTFLVEYKEFNKEWPLRFSVDLFNTPPTTALMSYDSLNPNSKIGMGVFLLVNDTKNDGLFNPVNLDSIAKEMAGNITDSIQDFINNYPYMRSENKDWVIGTSKRHFVIYCSDQKAANYVETVWDHKERDKIVSEVLPGYNLMQAINIRHDGSDPSFPGTIQDGFERVNFSEEIQFLVSDDWKTIYWETIDVE